MPTGWDLEFYDMSKEAPDIGLSTALSIITGVTLELSNALAGDQGRRQKYRNAMYEPSEKNYPPNEGIPNKRKKTPKPRKRKSFIEKVPTRKSLRSTVGFGGNPKRAPRVARGATKGDIRRAGISSLKRGSKSLAAFIAARYSAEAIAKYQDYAGRLRRSIRLRRQVVEIDANTFRIKGYIIKTDTAGIVPYSCTCPDFSQFSADDRNWLGSKAGPFNPCKHMMAVRNRAKSGKYSCSGGVCSLDPNGTYLSKAACEAALINTELTGGQCPVRYNINYSTSYRIGTSGDITNSDTLLTTGPLTLITRIVSGQEQRILGSQGFFGGGYRENVLVIYPNGAFNKLLTIAVSRQDGGNDNCGNQKPSCPL